MKSRTVTSRVKDLLDLIEEHGIESVDQEVSFNLAGLENAMIKWEKWAKDYAK